MHFLQRALRLHSLPIVHTVREFFANLPRSKIWQECKETAATAAALNSLLCKPIAAEGLPSERNFSTQSMVSVGALYFKQHLQFTILKILSR